MQGIHSWFSFVKSFLVHRGQKQKQTSIDLPLIRKMDRTFLRNHLKLKNNWEVVSMLERHSYLAQVLNFDKLKLWNCDLKYLSDWFSSSAQLTDLVIWVRPAGFLVWFELGSPSQPAWSQWCGDSVVRENNVRVAPPPLPGSRLYPAREDGVSWRLHSPPS